MEDFKQTKCTMCDEMITYEEPYLGSVKVPPPNICDKCSELVEQKHALERLNEYKRERRNEFNDMCPEGMRKIDLNLLPCDPALMQAIKAHDITRGLIIHGLTGLGKTRLMWQLAKRIYVHEIKSIRVLKDAAFGRMIERSYSEGMGKHDELIESLCNIPSLFIDDLGKGKINGRTETDIFSIIDERYASDRPTIITTQYVGRTLEARFETQETGVAFVRRIRESCEEMHLKECKKTL